MAEIFVVEEGRFCRAGPSGAPNRPNRPVALLWFRVSMEWNSLRLLLGQVSIFRNAHPRKDSAEPNLF